jgi:hypothetical protein
MITEDKQIGHVKVLRKIAGGIDPTWSCQCGVCKGEYVYPASKLRNWIAKLKGNPACYIACRDCQRRWKNGTSYSGYKARKAHFLNTAPQRKRPPMCSECLNMPWERPIDGSPCRCGRVYADEVIPTAVHYAATGSAGLQAMQATGYAHFQGTSGGRTR